LARPHQPRSSHERSAEERKRARQQRALRRAGGAELPPDPADPACGETDDWAVPQPLTGGAEGAGRAGQGAKRTRQRLGAPGRRRSARARVAAVAALLVTAGAVWFLVSLFEPFAGAGSGSVIVVIPKGSSASRIGSILARDGVVPSGFFFEVRALLEGKRGDLHSGRFRLRHNMSYAAAIAALSAPPPAVIAVTVVIPEGFTRLQIARLAERETLSGSYLQASARSPLLDPVSYGAPRGSGLEGFLFPATYQLSAGDPAARLVAQQLSAFQLRFGAPLVRRARALGLTAYELLTVASMIEREAKIERDRPLIAAVIYNRLRFGMPLGIDATIYYALALREGVQAYERELTASDLRVESPYNTRAHAGLPPTPIANPGLASIEAAAHPARVPYLYYVAAPDGCGEHVFSTSSAQFEADAAAYQAALRRNGGHLPACKTK
jgi:peptidoglycan lytic transglycosylase G